MKHSTVPRTHGISWWHTRPQRPIKIFLLTSWATMWWQTSPPQKEPASTGPRQQLVSSWKPRAAPQGAWPFHSAFLADFLSHPETHSPGPRALPLPPTALCLLGQLFLPTPCPPPLPPSLSPPPSAVFAKALEGESWAKEGLGFSILSRFPLHRQPAFHAFFPYYHKGRNLH